MYLYVPHLVIDSNEIMKTLKKKSVLAKKKKQRRYKQSSFNEEIKRIEILWHM
jgi:hypothetical protein